MAAGKYAGCLLTRTGDVKCWGTGGPVGAVAGMGPARWIGTLETDQYNGIMAAIDTSGRLFVIAANQAFARDHGIRRVVGQCLLSEDGGVSCQGQAVSLPGPALELGTFRLGGCVVLDSGSTYCWDYGLPAAPMSGVWPFARTVVGSRASGCALSGINGVQCWGYNYVGELGREGAATTSAVSVPMGEPVVALTSTGAPASGDLGAWAHRCALLASGRVLCWGHNAHGELGQVPLLRSDAPIRAAQ